MNYDARTPEGSISFALAFVGGYGDAISFVLAKTFTGHITGSLVLGAIAVAARDWRGVLARFLAVVCFLAGILLSALVARTLAAWSRPLLPTAMGIEAVLIVAGYWALASSAHIGVELFVACMSLALGLQNGAFRRTGSISVHTTYLTGMITGLLATNAEKYLSPATGALKSDPRFDLLSGIWIAFVLGAGIVAALVFALKAFAVLGAAALLMGVIVLTIRSDHPVVTRS